MTVEPALARKMHRTLEPYHGIIYFSPEAAAAYKALGLPDRQMGYFASPRRRPGPRAGRGRHRHLLQLRAGRGRCAASLRRGTLASPAALLDARLAGIDADPAAGPRRGHRERRGGGGGRAGPSGGRGLHARGSSALRRPRLACLGPTTRTSCCGTPSPCCASTAATGTSRPWWSRGSTAARRWSSTAPPARCPAEILKSSRARTDEEWAAAEDRLRRARAGSTPTAGSPKPGRAHRQWVEDRTDELAVAPWRHLGVDGCNRLRELVRPLSKAIVASGTFGFRPEPTTTTEQEHDLRDPRRHPTARRGRRRDPVGVRGRGGAGRGAVPRLPRAGLLVARPDPGAGRGRLPRHRAGPARLRRQLAARPRSPTTTWPTSPATWWASSTRSASSKAVFVGHDWGGFIVWQMPLLHPDRVAGDHRRQHALHAPRADAARSSCSGPLVGEDHYIVWFQTPEVPDAILAADVPPAVLVADAHRRGARGGGRRVGGDGRGRSGRIDVRAPHGRADDGRARCSTPDELAVYVDTFSETGFTGGINWYRNLDRNWEATPELDGARIDGVPCLMVTAEWDPVLVAGAGRAACASLVGDLEMHEIDRCGHWTPAEQPGRAQRAHDRLADPPLPPEPRTNLSRQRRRPAPLTGQVRVPAGDDSGGSGGLVELVDDDRLEGEGEHLVGRRRPGGRSSRRAPPRARRRGRARCGPGG